MIRYENECVGPCPMGCISSCRYKHVPYIFCDECGAEIDYDSPRANLDEDYHICEKCEPDEDEEEEEE